MPSDITGCDETQFGSDFWSTMWKEQGISKELVDSGIRREGYRIMSSYLHELGGGRKVLDYGCGLGE